MSNKIPLPRITAQSPEEKLMQVQSYLYQVVQQLNLALDSLDRKTSNAAGVLEKAGSSNSAVEKEAQSTFNSIKALIIKSADIVNAYYEEINRRLSGIYVAESDFGVYSEETAQAIQENSSGIERLFTNIQTIVTDIETLEHSLIEANAYINSGLLYYEDSGVPVYGLEIGQRNEIDGVEVFNKYARFTASKLSFYDQNDNEVAYVSDQKLYITHVEVKGSFTEGGFVDNIQSNGEIVTKWVGTGG